MTIPVMWSGSWTAEAVNHLWQSTVVVGVAWLVAMALRKNHARVRYWVWMAASVKFLVPFSVLIVSGEWIRSLMPATAARPAVAVAMKQVTQRFAQMEFFGGSEAPVVAQPVNWLLVLLLAIWAFGALIVLARFGRGWWKGYAAQRAARQAGVIRAGEWTGENHPSGAEARTLHAGVRAPHAGVRTLHANVPVLSSRSTIEPGVFGIIRPALLIPEGIFERLTAEQLGAIIAHEMCHVRRRDNLTFALHMLVETLFWFHPVIWWIGTKLVEERERACDDAVVQSGSAARVYAEGILNVCKFYVESPLVCAAGVTGGDLKHRIVRIMDGVPSRKLSLRGRLLLIAIGVASFAAPFAVGLVSEAHMSAQLLEASGPLPSFEVATIKPSQSAAEVFGLRLAEERLMAENIPLARLIRFAYNVKSDNQIENVPAWASTEKFDINAKIADAQFERMKDLAPDRRFEQYQFMLQSLLADRFKLKVSTRTKKMPVYALVVAKSGLKLTEAAVSTNPRDLHYGEMAMTSKGELKANAISTARIVQWLSGTPESGGRAVIDTTGLTGRYDFILRWSPVETGARPTPEGDSAHGPAAVSGPDSFEPSLFTALQEQLGLKLVPEKAPVEVLLIDHVEKPSPN